jgi:hypothetical protein
LQAFSSDPAWQSTSPISTLDQVDRDVLAGAVFSTAAVAEADPRLDSDVATR